MDTVFFREKLKQTFDDVQLDALCMDNFVEVYDRFARGMRRDEKINLLLDYCRREEGRERRLAELLGVSFLGEDGQRLTAESEVAPLEAFDASFLESLPGPYAPVRLRDRFYVRRKADEQLGRAIVKLGTTMTILAPRQTGKTSLLARGLCDAGDRGQNVVLVDMRRVGRPYLQSLDAFLRYLAEVIIKKLRLVVDLSRAWAGDLGPQDKLSYWLEDEVLTAQSFVLAIDNAHRLLKTSFYMDFFALLRSWHDERAYNQCWDKLNMLLVISTSPDLLIENLHQSPFNVGQRVTLQDFSASQIADLNRRYREPLSEGELRQLYKWLGGHPYLTRQAFYTLLTEGWRWEALRRVALSDEGPFGQLFPQQSYFPGNYLPS